MGGHFYFRHHFVIVWFAVLRRSMCVVRFKQIHRREIRLRSGATFALDGINIFFGFGSRCQFALFALAMPSVSQNIG